MKKPSCFQVTYSAVTGMAKVEFTSQDGSGASGPRMELTSPPPLNRNSHTETTATLAATYGTKNATRKNVRPRMAALSADASTSETNTVNGTLMTRKIPTLRND